jgi:folate-dependent phosphoribosylglycinamide formyltransferase PurN
MRILICSKRDLTSVVILNDLLRQLGDLPDCRFGLLLAERTRQTETVIPELTQIKFYERDLPFGIIFPLLDATAPERPELLTLKALIGHHRMPTAVVRGMRDAGTRKMIGAFRPDLILSVRFSFIFRPDLIALPRCGVLNIHPGRLPAYAGLYPHFHSMMAGEPTLGCTVHRIVDAGIDTGPVVAEASVPIDPRRSAFDHNLDSHLLGNRLATGVVAGLLEGRRHDGVPQDLSHRRYNTYPTQGELAEFHARGFSLFDVNAYLTLLRRFGLPDAEGDRFQPDLAALGRDTPEFATSHIKDNPCSTSAF